MTACNAFGGLSGNLGASHSAFLLDAGLGKVAPSSTAVVLACVDDVTLLGVYAGMSGSHMITDNAGLVMLTSDAGEMAFLADEVPPSLLHEGGCFRRNR